MILAIVLMLLNIHDDNSSRIHRTQHYCRWTRDTGWTVRSRVFRKPQKVIACMAFSLRRSFSERSLGCVHARSLVRAYVRAHVNAWRTEVMIEQRNRCRGSMRDAGSRERQWREAGSDDVDAKLIAVLFLMHDLRKTKGKVTLSGKKKITFM